MSGQLLEIKKKMQGVQNTRKITKAMKLVAASKMRQFQKRAVSARNYTWDLLKVLHNNIDGSVENLFTTKRNEGKVLFVLYTSDKGLCGSLNNKLISALIRSEKWIQNANNRMLITIGNKSYKYAQNNKIPVSKHFPGIKEKMTDLDALKIVDVFLDYWQNKEIKEIIFVAPHYKNSFTFYPRLIPFLPFNESSFETITTIVEDENHEPKATETSEDKNDSMIYGPDQESVLQKIHENVIRALFIQSFMELKASEYSSRMMAMQNATDAADKISGELKQKYNNARQQAITQEIAELIGASMALADED